MLRGKFVGRTLLGTGIVIGLFVGYFVGRHFGRASGTIGRFQFQTYSNPDDKGKIETGVWRLDSATGDVWRIPSNESGVVKTSAE